MRGPGECYHSRREGRRGARTSAGQRRPSGSTSGNVTPWAVTSIAEGPELALSAVANDGGAAAGAMAAGGGGLYSLISACGTGCGGTAAKGGGCWKMVAFWVGG